MSAKTSKAKRCDLAEWMRKKEPSALQAIKDEVLRKIGRNMILCKQIKGLLKLLLRNSHVQGTASDSMAYQEQRMEGMKKQMMGPPVK